MSVQARPFDVVVGRALGTVLVTVRGTLDQVTAREFSGCLDEVFGERPERVVIDLTGLDGLDTMGAAALRTAKRQADRDEVQVQLTSRNPGSLTALASAGLDQVFPVI